MIYSFISLPFCPDPDLQIYADPDPGRAKTCGSVRIRIRNPVKKALLSRLRLMVSTSSCRPPRTSSRSTVGASWTESPLRPGRDGVLSPYRPGNDDFTYPPRPGRDGGAPKKTIYQSTYNFICSIFLCGSQCIVGFAPIPIYLYSKIRPL